jgi:hypothetical protein
MPQQKSMGKWWITVVLLCPSTGGAQGLKITARLFNQSHVSQSVLATAEEEATYALQTAAVDVRWVDCALPASCDRAVGPDEFEILVRKAAPSTSSQDGGVEALGQALLPRDKPGCYAMAYFSEIRRVANRTGAVSAGQILGYVIAHEIGHLLLGARHEDGTIMQERWSKVEFEMMAKRQLRFDTLPGPERKSKKMAQTRMHGGHSALGTYGRSSLRSDIVN